MFILAGMVAADIFTTSPGSGVYDGSPGTTESPSRRSLRSGLLRSPFGVTSISIRGDVDFHSNSGLVRALLWPWAFALGVGIGWFFNVVVLASLAGS